MPVVRNIVFVLCLIVGIAGRFWGAQVNRESNDDHVEVVQRIITHQSISHRDSCWECFQPPLFYKVNATIALWRGKTSRTDITRQMQFENFLFSLLSVYLIFLLLKHEKIPRKIQLLITGFWLINPALFSSGIQSTNDTIIIFLGTLATYWLLRFIWFREFRYIFGFLIVITLAPLFKGSGIAVFLIGALLMIITLLVLKKYRALLLGLTASLYLLVFHSHYTHNYRQYGDPFTINQDKTGAPPFFDNGQEFWKRPGITSVWSGYFKLRAGSLLRTPHNINSGDDYPIHRTSFWAQMYGSFFHAQFLFHPQSWASRHPDLLNIARITFVLGLLPVLIFLTGVFTELRRLIVTAFNKDHKQLTIISLLHFAMVFGFLAFNIKYSYDYRDFGCIKAIFMLPAMMSITWFFYKGLNRIPKGKIKQTAHVILWCIVLLCTINDLFLLVKLS